MLISIAIIDDHSLFRQSLGSLIQQQGEMNVILQAASGEDLIADLWLRKSTNAPLPEVILMDIRMPKGMNGIQATCIVHHNFPQIKIIGLSASNDEEVVSELLHFGAMGFLTKNVEYEVIAEAVNTVLHNKRYIPGYDNTEHLLCNHTSNGNPFPQDPLQLTVKQKGFLQYSTSALTYEQIAVKMEISNNTANRYREDLFMKMNVRSRVEMIMHAIKNGWIE
jgi:two-component system invasion response regulator UvrY